MDTNSSPGATPPCAAGDPGATATTVARDTADDATAPPHLTPGREASSYVGRMVDAALLPRLRLSTLVIVVAIGAVIPSCASDDRAESSERNRRTTSTIVEGRSDAPMETVTVFRSGDDGYSTFRIPAVVRAGDGALIAFAEARVASVADDGNVDLVSRRSTDDGRTWGGLQVVADFESNFIGNPSPMLDSESNRLVLLATYKNAADKEFQILDGTGVETSREHLLTSDDDGKSWSTPTDITDSVKRPEWRWYSVGPGHAFQLRTGPNAGRLVAPANHTDAGRNYGAHLLLSDDGGRTWRIGAVDTPQGGPLHPNETTGSQVADGTIVVSARDQDGQDEWHRLRTASVDGGETFTAPFVDQVGLVTPVVQASMLWSGSDAAEDAKSKADAAGRLLLSAPSGSTERVDLRVRTSIDAGATWQDGLLVREGPSGYSDLVSLPGGAIGVLYETGDAVATERIDFATFGVDLLGG